jgi:hypothetical protein
MTLETVPPATPNTILTNKQSAQAYVQQLSAKVRTCAIALVFAGPRGRCRGAADRMAKSGEDAVGWRVLVYWYVFHCGMCALAACRPAALPPVTSRAGVVTACRRRQARIPGVVRSDARAIPILPAHCTR